MAVEVAGVEGGNGGGTALNRGRPIAFRRAGRFADRDGVRRAVGASGVSLPVFLVEETARVAFFRRNVDIVRVVVRRVEFARAVAEGVHHVDASVASVRRRLHPVRFRRTNDRRDRVLVHVGAEEPAAPKVDFAFVRFFVEIHNAVVARRFFHKRKERNRNAKRRVVVPTERRELRHRRERVVSVVIVLERQTDLFQVVRALHAARRFASRLNRREKKPDQDADDRDNDQQFDESEAVRFAPPPPFYQISTLRCSFNLKIVLNRAEKQFFRHICLLSNKRYNAPPLYYKTSRK